MVSGRSDPNLVAAFSTALGTAGAGRMVRTWIRKLGPTLLLITCHDLDDPLKSIRYWGSTVLDLDAQALQSRFPGTDLWRCQARDPEPASHQLVALVE